MEHMLHAPGCHIPKGAGQSHTSGRRSWCFLPSQQIDIVIFFALSPYESGAAVFGGGDPHDITIAR
jgi:hypothetical protein